ncbi:hypothetical protein OFO16_07320 [Vibrio natriegens]|nr:hypothetical protein [Vibrio natriegens]UYI48463.1 hypothetical protein OFO16_07320 [Vibrio natriegens]
MNTIYNVDENRGKVSLIAEISYFWHAMAFKACSDRWFFALIVR